MTLHTGQVGLLHIAAFELRLQFAGKSRHPAEHHHAGGVGIQAMRGPGLLRGVHLAQDVAERIAMEPPAGVHGQRGRFVQHDDGIVFVQDRNVAIHSGLDLHGLLGEVVLPRLNDLLFANGHVLFVHQATGMELLLPVFAWKVIEHIT